MSFEKEQAGRQQQEVVSYVTTLDDACLRPLARIAQGIENLVSKYDDMVTTIEHANFVDRVMSKKLPVRISSGCFKVNSSSCNLMVAGEDDSSSTAPKVADLRGIPSRVRSYTENLRSIAAAESSSQVESSLSSALDAVDQLSQSLGMARSADTDTLERFSDIGRLRSAALRLATKKAAPVLNQSKVIVATGFVWAKNFLREKYVGRLQMLEDDFNQTHTNDSLNRLWDAAKDNEALQSQQPDQIFTKMIEAHGVIEADLETGADCGNAAIALEATEADLNRAGSSLYRFIPSRPEAKGQ